MRIKERHCFHFFIATFLHTYADVNECLEAVANQRDICPANTVCVNTIGSFQCVCVPGYELVDGTCQRKFEYISEQFIIKCVIVHI